MGSNRLKLNANKTQLIWIGTRQQLAKLTVTQLKLINSVVEFIETVVALGVVLDAQLSMSQQVAPHPIELYWFRASAVSRGSEVSPSTDRPPGTVCRLHYEHQSCRTTPSHVH